MERLNEGDLSRPVDTPLFKDFHPSVQEALLQVVMHSQAHRAQCATRLRVLGGKPPTTDFILWVKQHPEPVWSVS